MKAKKNVRLGFAGLAHTLTFWKSLPVGIYNGFRVWFKKNHPDAFVFFKKVKELIKEIPRIIKFFFPSMYLSVKYHGIKPENYLSVVAIIKNEGAYIVEWLEYHLIVGVTKFYIYDNESEDNLKTILEPYIKCGIVEYKYCPGRAKQLWVYNDILKKARKETYWLAVIDCDEFIVPISTETIPELLEKFEGYGGLGINWLVYGSSGQKNRERGLVIERFKDHSQKDFHPNIFIKTIINPRFILRMDIHRADYIINKFCVDSNTIEIERLHDYNKNVTYDKIRINHYFTKSYEEYKQKRKRGKADYHDEIRPMDDFYHHDRNEEKNDTIMDKYIPIIYNKIEWRSGIATR